MKEFLRTILKNYLGLVSRKTIRKHGAEVIVITGWAGSGLVRELSYHLLQEKYNVRRNTTEVWWDFSVPLAVLGYEDKEYSVPGWLWVMAKSALSLILRPKYPHKIIINLDTSVEDIAEYWSKNISPNIVIVLKERPDSKVLKKFLEISGNEKILYIYNPDDFKGLANKISREFIFSSAKSDLTFSKTKNSLKVNYKERKYKISIPSNMKFIYEFVPPAIALGLQECISLEKLTKYLATFEPHPNQLKVGIKHLKEFINSNE
jgi:UDP-N-acetylmuramyl pentapeptide synthase